jgi:hypothetical protein
MVNLNKILPTPEAVMREALIVLGGVLIAAFVLSRFPGLKAFVTSNSVTVPE